MPPRDAFSFYFIFVFKRPFVIHFDLFFFLKRPRVVIISAGLPFDLRFLTFGLTCSF